MMFFTPFELRKLKGGALSVRFSFCKKSLFSIQFLFFFFCGTISGVLLLRCLLHADGFWLAAYCADLQKVAPKSFWMFLWFLLLPFLCAIAIGFSPYKKKLFPILFFLRGCVYAYTVGAYYSAGVSLFGILLRSMLFIPVFFTLCYWLWDLDVKLVRK